jgi:flagellar protein FliO/FliZ
MNLFAGQEIPLLNGRLSLRAQVSAPSKSGSAMDVVDLMRYLGALAVVLGLLGTAFVVARKYGLPGVVAPQGSRRLVITETLMIDGRHRAVLLRRDDTEYLIVIGPNGTTAIESGSRVVPTPGLTA